MIPKAITAPFRWWAKQPWRAFWGITLLGLLIIIIAFHSPNPGTLLGDVLFFTIVICIYLLPIAWIVSFGRGVFVTWQRSKFDAVLAVAAIPITIIVGNIILMQFSHRPHNPSDADVKANLKNAATAQEAYFVDHDTYTTNIGSLPGYNQSHNVTMSASATKTTFVITGTATKRCKPDTGTWSINGTTGEITGTRCR